MARPTLYTTELGEEICRRLAERQSLNAICKAEHMPAESTVRGWALDPKHPIAPGYAHARQVGYLGIADELLDIADDGTNDYVTKQNKDGSTFEALNSEHVQRSKLRVDTRKWVLAKMLPKVFGDKVVNEHVGKDGGPVAIETKEVTDLEAARRIAFMLGRAVGRQESTNAAKPADVDS